MAYFLEFFFLVNYVVFLWATAKRVPPQVVRPLREGGGEEGKTGPLRKDYFFLALKKRKNKERPLSGRTTSGGTIFCGFPEMMDSHVK